MKWQTIESAPKDGTHVLVLIYGSVYEAWWDETGKWRLAKADQHGCGCCGGDEEHPTHWMPLPEMPEDTQGEGGHEG